MKKFLLFCFLFILLDLFTINLNIVNAYTFTDFVEFVQNAYDFNYANNIELLRGIEPFLQNQSIVKNKFGTDLDNGQGYILRTGWNSSDRRYYYEVYLIQLNDNSYRTGATLYNVNYRYVSGYSSPVNPSISNWFNNTTYSSSGYNRAIFLVSNIDMSGMTLPMGNNFYIGSVKRQTEIDSDTDILFDVVIGNHWNSSIDSFKLYSGDIYIQDLSISWQQTNNDILQATLSPSNYLDIKTGNNYNLRVFIDNTLRYKSIDNTFVQYVPVVIPPGTITNNSGEVTGSINLDEINNNIADLPQNIGKVFYNSGDSGEKGIIQKVYEDLFTLDSGDVQDIYDNLAGKIDSGDTPLVVFSPFLDVLRSEPGDFIISWDNIPLHLTFNDGQDLINTNFISGDSINFSALARNNDTIGVLKFWINTILAFSIFTMITLDLYKLVLRALGVTTEFVNDMDQEEETTVLYNSISQSSTLDAKTGELKPRPVVYTTTKSTRRRL